MSSPAPQKTEDVLPPSSRMGILEHLAELRFRLIRCLLVWLALFLICWGFDKELAEILLAPIQEALARSGQGGRLITITLPEAFLSYLNVAFVISLFLASPYLFYQLWAFASPGLKKGEKRHILPLALSSAALFCTGAAFAYFAVFPAAFTFFIQYAADAVSPEPSLRFYLSLALTTLMAFGFAFQLPLGIFFLVRLGVVSPETLISKRKHAIVGAFIVGAVLTPPDPVSQTLLALPLIGLYELGILACKCACKAPQKTE